MNEENGYVVPDSQPNLRSINPYASRPEDPEYVYPDACSRNNKYKNVIGASKPVVEIPKDKYGYITLQEDSVLPSGVYSPIAETTNNQTSIACKMSSITTSIQSRDVFWKQRFKILLIVFIIAVVALLIVILLLSMFISSLHNIYENTTTNVNETANVTSTTARVLNEERITKNITFFKCKSCNYSAAKSLCKIHDLVFARVNDWKQIEKKVQDLFNLPKQGYPQLIWTETKTPEMSATSGGTFKPCLLDPFLVWCRRESDYRSPRVIMGVLCQKA